MRRDAQIRRDALIRAAAECFEESGYAVALEDVAKRAGVGRGTLYRNFEDRMALILAIFEREIERLTATVDPTVPFKQMLAELVRQALPASHLFARLSTEMPLSGANLTAFRALGLRLEELIEPATVAVKSRGELRASISGRDIIRSMQMVVGILHPGLPPAEIDDEIERAVELLLHGLQDR